VTSYANTGLTASTSYSYRVRAYNAVGGSNYSNVASAVTQAAPTAPLAPTNLAATVVSKSQINLSWTDNATNETGFRIQRCKGSTCTNFSQIAAVGANVTSYSNTKLTANTTYRYRVLAYNAVGASGYSNIVTAKNTRTLVGEANAPVAGQASGSPPCKGIAGDRPVRPHNRSKRWKTVSLPRLPASPMWSGCWTCCDIPHLVPCSLRLAEGREMLAEQLTCEGRAEVLLSVDTCGGFRELLRALCSNRFALSTSLPALQCQARGRSRCRVLHAHRCAHRGRLATRVDLEGSRDRAILARLRTTYQSIGRDAQLTLLEV